MYRSNKIVVDNGIKRSSKTNGLYRAIFPHYCCVPRKVLLMRKPFVTARALIKSSTALLQAKGSNVTYP